MDPSASGGGGSGVLGGYAGPGVKAAAAVVDYFGKINEGKAASAAFRYKAGMAQVNKTLALQNADYTRKMGEVQAGESGMRSRFQMGKIISGQSASGFDVNAPGSSAVGVRQGQQQIAQIDQGIIRANAARRAYGYDVEAAKDESESQVNLAAAENVKSASQLAGISSLLGGASSVADRWTQASQVGLYNRSGSGYVVTNPGGGEE